MSLYPIVILCFIVLLFAIISLPSLSYIQHQDKSNLPNLKTWLLDMQVTPDGVLVLAAGVNTDVSSEMYYALGRLTSQ